MKRTMDSWMKTVFPKADAIRGEHYMLTVTLVLMAVFMVGYKLMSA